MTHAFLLLAKHGDLLSALPILKHRFDLTGQKQSLVVAKSYRAVADRASYVNPVEWPGQWGDLHGALRFAKRSFDQVTCLSTYGEGFAIQKRLPGFQLDQWDRAGMLKEWDQLPFELARGKAAETNGRPFILFADHSESSPFSMADSLAKELTEAFPDYKLVRLSSVREDNPCDLLGLFDKAAALVTIETMTLHLSKFSPVPTVALVTDHPSRWHGSSWSRKFRLHVRYSDYEQRKVDIIHAVRDAVNNVEQPKIEEMPEARPLSYNPSLMRVGDKVWKSWRWHPDKTSWRTEIEVHDDMFSYPLTVEGFEKHSIEDGRLFMFQGKPHLSFTISRSPLEGQNFSPCVTAYGELKRSDGAYRMGEFYRPQFGKNDWNGQEKNVVFMEHDGKLFCIWQCSPEQTILCLDKSRVVSLHKSPCPECSFGQPKGGTQPFDFHGKLLRFVHVQQRNPKSDQWWTYHLAAVVMEPTPPFKIVQISSRPILIGSEKFFPHRFWKPRCILPFGAIEEDDGWRVAIGINDSQSATVKLTEKELNL